MEAPHQDDPRRFGRFTVLARLHEGAGVVRYAARDTASGEVAVVTAAHPALAAVPAFRHRFQAEARTAERLAGDWVAPLLDAVEGGTATPAGEPAPLWTAAGYVPALALADAVRLAGPLPERSLRVLGAGIAEVLSRVHAGPAVLQGLAPGTVLLAEDGPRLTAFGPLGAAASAEAGPGGRLSVRLAYLTPEQIEGREVSAASDLFVLGLLLAYAATGTTPFTEGPAEEAARRIAQDEPDLDAVPDALRALIAGCLAKDPAERPDAAEVATALAAEGAAVLARGGWLPERLRAAVADQEARVRALEPPVEAAGTAPDGGETGSDTAGGGVREDRGATRLLGAGPRASGTDHPTARLGAPHEPTARPSDPRIPLAATPPASPAPPAATGPAPTAPPRPDRAHGAPAPYPAGALPGLAGPGGPGGGPMVALPLPPASAPDPAASRRTLLTIAAAAVGGLVVGGGAVAALGSGDPAVATDAEPAAKPRRTLPGQAPEPLWSYTHPASDSAPITTALWRDELLVVTSGSRADAVDLRTGKRRWQRADAAKGQAALEAGDDLCFVASPTEFLWLSPKDGTVVHRLRCTDGFSGLPGLKVGRLAGQSGPVIWFTGSHTVTVKAPKPEKGEKPAADEKTVQAYFFAYDILRRTELWRTSVPAGRSPGTPAYRVIGERAADILVRQESGTLTAAEVKAAKGKGSVRSFDRRTGKLLWTEQYGTASPVAGIAGDEDGSLFAAVGTDLQAFETDTAKPLWRVAGHKGSVFGTPVIAGSLIHTTERTRQVGAVERESGRLVWRRSTDVPGIGNAPSITLSGSGKTLVAADAFQVTAFAAADGRRLWKFQDIGSADPQGGTAATPYRTLAVGGTLVVRRGRSFYAFPVD
ncbi:PQQ-binding-like beta-propeller repeat protein [Streptomyces pratensis]|uniref:outer membrane protein assembly factor BamB family protein n=1 Tax=Streptomyces pratensis TaxID=1169025 RepID=UPI00301796C8